MTTNRPRRWNVLAIGCALAALSGCGASAPAVECADPLMIDDLEDGDRFTCKMSGRRGAWYGLDDGSGMNVSPRGPFTPTLIPGGRAGSLSAAHLTGVELSDWGAKIGFSLNGEGAAARPYDASAASGIRFWMKSNVSVRVGFPIPETMQTGAAATCVDEGANWNCDNHFEVGNTPPSTEWAEYQLPFAAARQSSGMRANSARQYEGSAVFDPSRLMAVEFAVYPSDFDVWIDDVRFYECASSDCGLTCTDPDFPVACPARGFTVARCQSVGIVCDELLHPFFGRGVWGAARDDVWMVESNGITFHWNGSAWSFVPGGTREWLETTWGAASDDVWAAGSYGAIIHWDGTSWSTVPSGTQETLYGLWGTASDDVWAVGSKGVILHWDGAAWSRVLSGTSYDLVDVWGSGPSDVWATGQAAGFTAAGVIVHWDGTSWSPVPEGAPLGAAAVGGSGPNDVWVVGYGAIVHWNGSAWSTVPSPTDWSLRDVWAVGPADAWIVGGGGTLIHWNGAAWSVVPIPTSASLEAVWFNGPSDVWAVGAKALHWDGAGWSVVPVEAPRGWWHL